MKQLSVIVPCYNGVEFVDAFVQAMTIQDADEADYELIISDNGSTDGTPDRLREAFADRGNTRVLSFSGTQSSYANRNHAVAASFGRLLAFTDIDCVPDPSWISGILKHSDVLEHESIISGSVELFPRSETWTVIEWADRQHLNQEAYGLENTGATANLIVPRSIYDAVGGFDEVTSGGDRGFCRKVSAKGFGFRYVPEIRVRHPARSTFESLAAKARRLGRGSAQTFFLKRPNVIGVFGFVARTLVALLLQMNQWRMILATRREGIFRSVALIRYVIVMLRLGWIARWSILITAMKYALRLERPPERSN